MFGVASCGLRQSYNKSVHVDTRYRRNLRKLPISETFSGGAFLRLEHALYEETDASKFSVSDETVCINSI